MAGPEGFGELFYINQAAREYHGQPPVDQQVLEDDRKALIEKVAAHPRLVALAEIDFLGYAQAVEPEEVKEIERLGRAAVEQMIIDHYDLSADDFNLAKAYCQLDVLEANSVLEYDDNGHQIT